MFVLRQIFPILLIFFYKSTIFSVMAVISRTKINLKKTKPLDRRIVCVFTLEFSRETCFLQLLGFLPVRSELRGWNNQAIIIYRSKDSKKFRWQAWSRSAITSSQICIWWRWWCRDFRLGVIHKVRQHFFSHFLTPPSPMSSLFLYLSVITFSIFFYVSPPHKKCFMDSSI